jgi:8-oxo-dGTP diphosphatase
MSRFLDLLADVCWRLSWSRIGVLALGIAAAALGCAAGRAEQRPRPPDRVAIREAVAKPDGERFASSRAYAHFLEAMRSAYRGECRAAVDELKLALVFDPEAAFLHCSLAGQYARLGEGDKAEAELNQAIALAPSEARAHLGVAQELEASAKPDAGRAADEEAQALSACRRALENVRGALPSGCTLEAPRRCIVLPKALPREEDGMVRKITVVGAMIERGGKYLITQRKPTASLPLLWEFPGGRVELGETDAQALARELKEEMDIVVEVGEQAMHVQHSYPDYDIDFRVYRCRLVGGEIRHLRVYDHRWVEPGDLDEYEFPPADQKTFEQLLEIQ